MGECGCSETVPDYKFPGPDGITYAVQVYAGCPNCNTPAGVVIYRFDDRTYDNVDHTLWHENAPELPFLRYSKEGEDITGEFAFPVVHADKIVAMLKGRFAGNKLANEKDNGTLEELIDDEFDEGALATAVCDTWNAFKKEVGKRDG